MYALFVYDLFISYLFVCFFFVQYYYVVCTICAAEKAAAAIQKANDGKSLVVRSFTFLVFILKFALSWKGKKRASWSWKQKNCA
jgi:hypothetical protein